MSIEAGTANSPVAWDRAIAVGRTLVRSGPVVSRSHAKEAVAELRAASPIAEDHVRSVTGLGAGLPLIEADVVDRPGWVTSAVQGIAALTDGAMTPPRTVLTPVLSQTAAIQAGAVLAFLAGRVLGQYDPFTGGDGKLLLVAPNIVAAERAMDVSSGDFRLWVCLHEGTHRLQFTAVPWLRDHFAEQVRTLLGSVEDTANGGLGAVVDLVRDGLDRVRSGDISPGPVGLLELVQTPAQRQVLDRLLAISTLLEGHADHVMDAVGPQVVPSVATIRERFTDRRRGGGLLDRLLRSLLGVDAKVRQYAEGAAFVDAVVAEVGMQRFNTVWTSPETLPTRAEIADHRRWLSRVAP